MRYRSLVPETSYDAFAIAAPGLAPLVALELASIGVIAGEMEGGGVAFRANGEALYSANLQSRCASRIVVRVDEFRASNFHELEKRTARIAWEEWLAPGRSVALRVTCRKSRLYHSGAVAERVAGVLARVTQSVALRDHDGAEREEEGSVSPPNDDAQRILVRIVNDRCTISIDSSGALLHKRGYRQAIGRAPLRETIAAAMLLATGWDGSKPLLDPFCGSGTIPIEGALMARRIAPGRSRSFAFQQWPAFDSRTWDGVVARARSDERPSQMPIFASDRDAGAIEASLANAERAGVAHDITFEKRSASSITPPAQSGLLVSNPPYGVRVGDTGHDLRGLYARLGDVLSRGFGGWTVALLSADPRLTGQMRIPLEERFRTSNGGIDVRLLVGEIPLRPSNVVSK